MRVQHPQNPQEFESTHRDAHQDSRPSTVYHHRWREMMGMKSAIAYGAEMFTLLLMTEESAEWGKAVAEKGLKAALAERDAAFDEK